MTEIPDLVGDEGRVQIVASAIRDLQVQMAQLDITQTINGATDDDTVPGLDKTFVERREQIGGALDALAEQNPKEMAAIRAAQAVNHP